MKVRHLVIATLLICPQSGWSQDSKGAVTSISPPQLKQMLDALKYEYQVIDGAFVIKMSKPGDKNVKYDLAVESFDKGKAIVVGCTFFTQEVAADNTRDAARLLSKVNDWNIAAALSRGMRRELTSAKGKQVFVPRLEADLDCTMGVTPQDVDRLIRRFPTALKEFELFVK